MDSSRPYLVRAIHEWLIDNHQTPYLLVNAEQENVQVPVNYVEKGKIVLNVSTSAVEQLHMDNDAVSFNARFGGQPTNIYIPISACMAIYSKENGQGMVFKEEQNNEPDEPSKKNLSKPSLKIVK
ncbi:Stringent starvation protein B [hydrothermal vent metagenome]|uniref:Stringent starvation protein B n=1 Tax=hydrothermal vent metagenome TaxID=652676 RepID=A0A3B1A041_9ZZZZ